jgi:hypothetical protein
MKLKQGNFLSPTPICFPKYAKAPTPPLVGAQLSGMTWVLEKV